MSPHPHQAARAVVAVIAALMTLTSLPVRAEPGSIGFSLAVSVDGFFSPKVARAEITQVKAGSAAEAAGLQPGDLLTRIEDCAIPGCPGGKAKELLAKEAGALLRLTVLRDGSEREVTVRVAAKE